MNLLDYIKGNRRGRNAHRIEKDAMQDPFLYEAIEGFDSVQDDHLARIGQIRNRLGAKSQKPKVKLPIYVRGAAASVIILFSLGGYFLIDSHKTDLHAQEGLDIHIIDIYVPTTFYKENIAVIAQHNTEFTRTFRPQVSRFSIEAEMHKSITQSERDILANDALANNDMPILIYMPNEDRYPDRNARREMARTSAPSDMFADASVEIEEIEAAEVMIVDVPVAVASPNKDIAEAASQNTEVVRESAIDEAVVLGHVRDKNMSSASSVKKAEKPAEKSQPIIGYEKYDAYLLSALQRPTDGICKDKKGKVLVEFSVDKDGKPYDVKVKYSLCGTCDKEAVRLVKHGPKWTPSNQPVTVKVQF